MKHNFLLLSSDAGSGHRRVAEALCHCLEAKSAISYSFHIIDFWKETGIPLLNRAPDIYNSVTREHSNYYNLFYRLTNKSTRVKSLAFVIFAIWGRRIAACLERFEPELIIVTNPSLISQLAHLARKRFRQNYKIALIVTDLVDLHQSWINTNVDFCFVPTSKAYCQMLHNGQHSERLFKVSYPINMDFFRSNLERHRARQLIQVDENRFTLLLVGGGAGTGNIEYWAREISKSFPNLSILVVTGKNQQAYKNLSSSLITPHTQIYEHIDNMKVLYMASDIVVTKAGPSTIMESIKSLRPLIITAAVGTQEMNNIKYIIKKNLGEYCPNIEMAKDAIIRLGKLDFYKERVKRLIEFNSDFSNGCELIAELLLKNPSISI